MQPDQTPNPSKITTRHPSAVPTVRVPHPTLIQPVTDDRSMAGLMHSYRMVVSRGEVSCRASYRVLAKLGEGRQGVVFRCLRRGARACETERAVKLLDPALYRSPDEYSTDMNRIANQISRLDGINSPHLVTRNIYEETDGIGYVEMEAIDGLDARRLLAGDHLVLAQKRAPHDRLAQLKDILFREHEGRLCLQPGVVVHMLESMLRGLERLHSTGFLHGDLKPSNIMIDRLGTVKIIDFGRAVTAGEKVTFLLGAPMYMAPEIHASRSVSIQSDLYSVGLVALELLRGREIIDDDNATEQELADVKRELFDHLDRALPPHVLRCRELARVLRVMLNPDPAKRYRTARQAAVGSDGIGTVEKVFSQAGFYTDCSRDLAEYLALLVDPETDRIALLDE